LLDTLAKGLGDEFTPEVREAWATAYGTLSGVMVEAQKSA
jgi:hemoglobin-like flavoprotein